jgi:hypothetical protein
MMGKHQSAPKLYYELPLDRLVPSKVLNKSCFAVAQIRTGEAF